MSRSRGWIVLAGAALAVAPVAAGGETPLPHGLSLLAGRVTDDAARDKLKAALGDPRPEVRAAAVRVINVSGVGLLVPAVVAALSAETERVPASEMIRFLGALDRPELDRVILDSARRLGDGVDAPLADVFARRTSATSHMATLRELDIDDSAWLVFYDIATAAPAESLGPLSSAILRDQHALGWRAVLRARRKAGAPLGPALAMDAVRSDSVEIRTATYWSLAAEFDPASTVDSALASALSATPEARAEGPIDSGAALAFEMLRRARGGAALPQVEAIRAVAAAGKTFRAWEGLAPLLRLVDKSERRAIATMVFDRADALDDWIEVPKAGPRADASSYTRVQTATGFPPGYVTDALGATGCAFERFGAILGGEVGYRADGRPREIGLIPQGGSKECLEAVRILLVSSLVPLGVPARAEGRALLLVPDRPEFTRCMDESARRKVSRTRQLEPEGSTPKERRIQEPKKVRDRRPHYPAAAKGRGVEGVVVLEAQIEASGCISEVALVRGRDTSLDLEAIRAVSAWAYVPARLEGEPVPVDLTVTINFTLSGQSGRRSPLFPPAERQ